MDKLHRTVNVAGKVYHDIVKPKEMTEVELLQAIAPFEIPKLRDKIEQLQTENAQLQSRLDKLANFNPDWDQLEACQESLREHMRMLNKAKPVLDAAIKYVEAGNIDGFRGHEIKRTVREYEGREE